MSKKLSLIFMLGLLTMVLLVSCQRTASQTPLPMLATPTGTLAIIGSGQPTGIGQVQMLGTTQMIQTMTAISQTSVPSGSLPTITLIGAASSTPNPFSTVPAGGLATTPAPGITPIVVVPTATPGRPATYTLMEGEFLYCIARRFNVNPDELLALNGFSESQILQPGTQLRIPATGSFPGNRSLHPHPAQYTVGVNDTIYSIACYFGDLDPTSIAAANGLSLTSPLTTGRFLNIP
jgi:LysM repeat protein